MEYISKIICAILGFLGGFFLKVILDKSRNSVVQKDIAANKVIGRDDNSTVKK